MSTDQRGRMSRHFISVEYMGEIKSDPEIGCTDFLTGQQCRAYIGHECVGTRFIWFVLYRNIYGEIVGA